MDANFLCNTVEETTVLIWAGLVLGLLTAGVSATKSIFTKISAKDTDSLIVTLFSRIFGFLVLFPLVLFLSDGMPVPEQQDVYVAVFIGGGILAFTSYLVTLALEKSDLSIVSPLLSFVPVAVIVPSTILVGETPTLGAGLGVVLISTGSYLLNIEKRSAGILSPIKSILNDKGAQFALLAVLLFSVVPSLNKLALAHTSPIILTSYQLPVSATVLSLVGFRKVSDLPNEVRANWKPLLGLGITTTLLFVFQLYGYQYTQVSYIQAIKQVKVIIAVLAGYYIFHEDNIKGRFAGGIVMFVGAVLVILLS